jgi:putative transposase
MGAPLMWPFNFNQDVYIIQDSRLDPMFFLYLSDNEGASHWLTVLTDLHNRGVEDILIACIDGLTGFPEAIASIYPKTEIQLCIIHQIRNSLKYVASKNQKAYMADLKPVYRATSLEAAEVWH